LNENWKLVSFLDLLKHAKCESSREINFV